MENTQNTLRKLFDWFAYHNQALEDAMNQAEDRNIKLSEEEAMNLAQVFNKRKDCNVADNDIWDDIIAEYMRN